MALKEYAQKRRFDSTNEPKAKLKKGKSKRLEFVVQKHAASHLHYDFRLELNGVLKSWAVPKGPSLRPEDKRLAMMVEDHPFDYRQFEGQIPKGNYGAGQVIVWDSGYYEPRQETDDPEKELTRQLNKGHLTFVLHGQKLKGEFALIRKNKMEDNAWLLIKKGDDYASNTQVTDRGESVISGDTIRNDAKAIELGDAPKADYPKAVKPMLATLINEVFDDSQWLFEIKWDGYRAIGGWNGRTAELYSRNNKDFSKRYRPIAEALRGLPKPAVIDGEIVVVDDQGRSRFEYLQNYSKESHQLVYYAFDVLWCDGRDVSDWPLLRRKELLRQLLGDSQMIKYSDHVIGKGEEMFGQAQKLELEGIMAKKCDSIYRKNYRSKQWLKIKTEKRQEVVIGGFTEPKGSRSHIGALIVGTYEGDKLVYCGHVGGGIANELLPKLRKQLLSKERKTSPFSGSFKPNGQVHWTSPMLVCEVKFAEWTKDGRMRQPIFVGMRSDKEPKQVNRELPKSVSPKGADDKRKGSVMTEDRIKFTHLEKVFWPDKGYTKGDLLDYYRTVAEVMLPYVKDHPCNLLRHHNGVGGKSFYQKDMASASMPDFVKTISVYSESNKKDIEYYVIDNVDALLYLVQLGCIEINPWNSRVNSLNNPEWAVVDLDPEDVAFPQVVEVALEVKKVCDRLDIPCFAKTSGQTGIHVFIPTQGKYTNEQVRQLSELIANLVHETTKEITSLERSPSKRQKKIYLDYLQNRESQTLAAPYSVRPTKEATVSAPLKWSEVNKNLRPQHFTIMTMPDRLKKLGDLWKPVIKEGIDLAKVLSKLD